MNLYQLKYNQLPLISAPKIHTDLLWTLSILFTGLAVLYVISVFFYRNSISKNSNRIKLRKRELSPMISEFLFYEEDATTDEKSNYVTLKIEIRELIKDKFNKKVLSEVLLDLRKDLSGDTQKRLFDLYKNLGLHSDDLKKLNSWRWEKLTLGMYNLTQMQVPEAYSFLVKYINDKRATIRKQAEIAIVTLKPDVGINYFLDTTTYKISEWQQLKLLDVLRNYEDYNPPRFKAWLTSTNSHVVLFAIRLMKFYNQNDADNALIELLKHTNNQIKQEAISCIKAFYIISALPSLKLVFWKSSTDVKIAILDTIGIIGTQVDIEFLKEIEKKEANFSVKNKALNSINTIAPGSILPTKGLLKISNYKIPDDIIIENKKEIATVDQITSDENTSELIPSKIDKNQIKNDTNSSESDDSKSPLLANKEVVIELKPMKAATNKLDAKKDESLHISFLPLVVEESKTPEVRAFDSNCSNDELNAIEVYFEEVPTHKIGKSVYKTDTSFEITEEDIAFLPVVTDNYKLAVAVEKYSKKESLPMVPVDEIEVTFEEVLISKQVKETKLPINFSAYNRPEIKAITVIYQEIPATFNKPTVSVLDSKADVSINLSKSSDAMNPHEEIKFKNILKGLIDFNKGNTSEEKIDAIEKWTLLEFEEHYIEASKSKVNVSDSKEDLETASFDQIVSDVPERFKIVIPKSKHSDKILKEINSFSDDIEESQMQLLFDITEMGDYREIPLLKELLSNEKQKTIRERIKLLISKFADDYKAPKAGAELKAFNVFEDLFRTCDTASKLILMDEIIFVGDQADIPFLEDLLKSEQKEISNKAARILEELKLKLKLSASENSTTASNELTNDSKAKALIEKQMLSEYDALMEELQISSPQASDIFNLTFAITAPTSEADKKYNDEIKHAAKKDEESHSIIEQIYSFSNKLISKISG